MKIDKWDKQKIMSKIASVVGKDGELYIGYEAGIPVKARELLTLYYGYYKKDRLHRWLNRLEQKEIRGWREFLEKMEYLTSVSEEKGKEGK